MTQQIGDSYVAVSGLPEPRKDHATVMAKFARDCLAAFNSVTTKLEVTLGPDTGDLAMRVGLHSGAVTAGVLRGDKARFQVRARQLTHVGRNRISFSILRVVSNARLFSNFITAFWGCKFFVVTKLQEEASPHNRC